MSNTKSVSVVAITVLSLGLNACGGFETKKKSSRGSGLTNSRALPMPPDAMNNEFNPQLRGQGPSVNNLPANPRQTPENEIVRPEREIERFNPADSSAANGADTRVSDIVVERSSPPAPKVADGRLQAAPVKAQNDLKSGDMKTADNKSSDVKSTDGNNAAPLRATKEVKADSTQTKTDQPQKPEANACTMTFLQDSRDWAPGIPYEPTKQPHLTYGTETLVATKASKGKKKASMRLNYTDSAVDGLMNVGILQTEKLPDAIKTQSKQLAIRIDDVKIALDDKQGSAKMHFSFEAQQRGKFVDIQLAGPLQGSRESGRLDADLAQVVNAGQSAGFKAHVTCADPEIGCQSVMIRLQQLGASGKAQAVAYILHRWGPVLVTMPERDRNVSKNIQNVAHLDFARFLSASAQNSCLSVIDGFAKGQRNVTACALERMVHDCGGEKPQPNAAKDFVLRTWSVAFGRAGFEWLALKEIPLGLMDYENKKDVLFSLSGELAMSQQRPMSPTPLVVAPADGPGQNIRTARLVMNDGGGNLNLQLLFNGKGKSQTRVTLTSLAEDTRFRERIAREIENMPELSVEAVESKAQPAQKPAAQRK